MDWVCIVAVVALVVVWVLFWWYVTTRPTPEADRRRGLDVLWRPEVVGVVRMLISEAVDYQVAEGHAIEASMRVMADRIEGAAQIMEEIETRLRRKFVLVERVAPGISVKDAEIRT